MSEEVSEATGSDDGARLRNVPAQVADSVEPGGGRRIAVSDPAVSPVLAQAQAVVTAADGALMRSLDRHLIGAESTPVFAAVAAEPFYAPAREALGLPPVGPTGPRHL